MTFDSVWFSPDLLDGDVDSIGFSSDIDDWDLPYNEVDHAFDILHRHESTGYLKDAVVNLERAIQFRLKRLNALYKFKKIPGIKIKSQLKAMLDLDLIKPIMLKKISDIRNGVQHNYKADVPIKDECLEMAEFAWYFLRSTDSIAKNKITDYQLICAIDDSEYLQDFILEQMCTIVLSIRGPHDCFSKNKVDGWIHLRKYNKDIHGGLGRHASIMFNARDFFYEREVEVRAVGVLEHGCPSNIKVMQHYFEVRS